MILLDTHAWVWWSTESPQLSRRAKQSITTADDVGVSIISCWEVAMLVAKQRIAFNIDVQEWIDLALQRPKIQLIPIDTKIAVLSTRLPGGFHDDPVDRLIVATCLSYGVPLVTKDKKIADWQCVAVVW